MEKEVLDLIELSLLSDDSLAPEIEKETIRLSRYLDRLEVELFLKGEYDAKDAFLGIHAGSGGIDAQDWAQMLLRMYQRWAENQGYSVKVLEVIPGEEAGIKSALLEIAGPYAYGHLKGEHGVHRLVRISPFDAEGLRHTSFALVEILPKVEEKIESKISPSELKIETFRSSGPGGQHMQKTSSAVRVTHLPTGITVSYQGSRSQHQNKEIALKILQARLLELELKKKSEELARLKGGVVTASWGNQIRSYVLHPYKLVKDHRTGWETSNAQAVLDGEIDEFIKVYLRSQR